MRDADRLRLWRDQVETEGTLSLSRNNLRWLFEMAAVGIEVRREPVAGIAGGRDTIVLAAAPLPRRRRRRAPLTSTDSMSRAPT
jgi:hypothetical protein